LPTNAATDNVSAIAEKRYFRASRAAKLEILNTAHFLGIGAFAARRSPRYSRRTDSELTMMETLEPVDSVPIIFTPPVERQTLTAAGRLVALIIALAALSVLITALLLKPSRDGVGTHLQMGFQRCQFLRTTNLPCPSCGMTTSFSYFAHGNWLASLYTQPGGFVLALLCGAIFWAGLYAAVTASPLQRLIRQIPVAYSVPIILGFFIAAWGWKIFIHLAGMDGWR
jgi:hypothetical protein